jgi:protein-arginine kinase activator protein McsA
METNNFIENLFIKSINVMKTGEWRWPDHWNDFRKIQFLTDSLNYAKQNEFWEQAAILRDVKKSIEEETGTVSGNTD